MIFNKPVIITSKYLPMEPFEAFTFFPFIVCRIPYQENVALINHETVHWKEQQIVTPFWWLAKYVFSKKFRYAAELRAYAVQCKTPNGPPVERVANLLATGYHLNISYETVLADLTALVK